MEKEQYTNLIKEEAKRLGFNDCGIAQANYLKDETNHLKQWLLKKMNGEMTFMTNYLDKRSDPRLLFGGAKSIISVILSYYPNKQQIDPTAPNIAKYAYGKDYHLVIKEKLFKLKKFIDKTLGENKTSAFVDSAPVIDKAWAARAGLGWIGKNSLLLTKKYGSFIFIGELVTNIELAYDSPMELEFCGECTKCIDDCPTNAIIAPKIINASKCISYQNIEKKNNPSEKLHNWVYGCDICQDVCPWNQNIPAHNEQDFNPHPDFINMNKEEWHNLSKEKFDEIFKGTPVERIKYEKLKKNLELLKE